MMQLQITDQYIKICIKTWLICEASVHAEVAGLSPRHNLVKECSDCAKACFDVVLSLVSNEVGDWGDVVLNCVLHCRQCSNECAKYDNDGDIQFCGMMSSICADTLKDITVINLN